MKQLERGVTLFKKLRKSEYNWAGKYIKEYNQMISYYEKIIIEKDKKIELLEKENMDLKKECRSKTKHRQICDKDINLIRQLKNQGKSYSYIANETGWSKATISRVINNNKNMY